MNRLLKISLTSLVLFIIITVFVCVGATENLDQNIDNWARLNFSHNVTVIFIIITNLGSGVLITLLVLLFLLISKRFKISTASLRLIIIAPISSYFLNYLIKNLIQRPRPALPHEVMAQGFSFPSGHAMVSFSFYIVIAYVLVPLTKKRHLPVALLSLLVVLIACSRVILHVHYLTDITAGMIAGIGWATFLIYIGRGKRVNGTKG